MYMCLTLGIIFYSLWCIDIGKGLILTIPFVIIIMMKYSLNIEKDSMGDPVEVILSDKILLALIMCFGILLTSILYFFPQEVL